MNIGPNDFDFKASGVYVVVEINQDLESHPNNWRPVVCCWSRKKAETYLTPDRKIYGPVPMVDGFMSPEPIPRNPIPRWDPTGPDFLRPDRDLFPGGRPGPDLDLAKPNFDIVNPKPEKPPGFKDNDPDYII